MYAEDRPNDKVPIYGVRDVPLKSSGDWDVATLGIQAPTMATWSGDQPRSFDFSFELTAGVAGQDLYPKTRQDLIKYMRWMHSWTAHQGEAGAVQSPPAVRLVLGDYINQRGVLRDVLTTGHGPWGGINTEVAGDQVVTVGSLAPTSCTFSGTFFFLPGYDQATGAIDVRLNTQRLNREQVSGRFFK